MAPDTADTFRTLCISASAAEFTCRAVFVRFSLGGVRVSTGYDWPSDYSGHGGCQIGKRRIVVHKYTGLARKWNRGLLGGLESTPPKRFCRTFCGRSTTSCGGQTPWPPVKYSPVYVPRIHIFLVPGPLQLIHEITAPVKTACPPVTNNTYIMSSD